MDAVPPRHPTDQTLSAFGLGKLDDRAAAAVNDHLVECGDCRKRVAEMSADSFLQRVRDAEMPSGSSASDPARGGETQSGKGTGAPAAPPADTLPPGLADHPDYEIKQELGRGGMGVVYLAHNKLMGRDEVLKVMGRQIMDRPGLLERFLREIRAVARLRHPNIVAAYAAVRLGECIVFAMEYVDGLDLSRVVKASGPLPIAHACNFVYQAALGLQHAHEEGLVHRDIKPHNLMLARKEDRSAVKVLDFGLARAAREEKVEGGLTTEGQALGTPDFIAPEQIIDAPTADIRADIYSLGATLYYLLTGRPPFQAKSLYDLYQAHISRTADPLNFVRPEVPAELAALVAKMMAKDPSRRFQTPGEVAQALTPFFKKANAPLVKGPPADVSRAGETNAGRPLPAPVSAAAQPAISPDPRSPGPAKAAEPAGAEARWENMITLPKTDGLREAASLGARRRRPRRVGSWVAALALLAGFFSAWAGGAFRVKTPARIPVQPVAVRDAAGQRKGEAKTDRFATTAEVVAVKPVEPRDVTARREPRAVERSRAPSDVAPPPRRSPIAVRPVETPSAPAGFQPLFNGKNLVGWKVHPQQRGNWHVRNGVLIGSGPALSHLYTQRGDFADFHLRALARFNKGGSSGLYVRCPFGPSLPADDPRWPDGYEATINNARVVRDSTGGLYPGSGKDVFIEEFGKITRIPFGEWFTLEVIADGNALSVLVNGKPSAYRSVPKGLHPSGHIALQQYSPETVVEFRKIEIEELNLPGQKDSREIGCFSGKTDPVSRVAFSPDGLGILSGDRTFELTKRTGGGNFIHWGHSYALRLGKAASGQNVLTMRGDGGAVAALAFSSDGRHAASCDYPLYGKPILVWDLKTGQRIHRFLRPDAINKSRCTALAFSPDDRRVMAATNSGTVVVWDLATQQEQSPIALEPRPIKQDEFPAAAFASDRKHLITGRETGPVERWDLQTGKRLGRFAGHPGEIRGVACSADGRLILSAGSDATVRLWDVATGKELKQLKRDDRAVRCVALSPDGRRALTAGLDGPVHLWDLASGKEVCRLEGHTMAVNSVAFSPDGRRGASGSNDRTVRLWQLPE